MAIRLEVQRQRKKDPQLARIRASDPLCHEQPLSEPLDALSEHSRAWAAMSAAGVAATAAERASLLAQGIAPVYQKDGVVVEELPDGSIRPLDRALAFSD